MCRLPDTDALAGVAVWRLANVEKMSELVFEVVQEADGGYCSECLTESISTQADSWDELRRNVCEAVTAFYFDGTAPASVRLHLVRDETSDRLINGLPYQPTDRFGLER